MIQRLQLLRNVGQFDSVTAGANLPLERVTVVYAENGRGKTTLAAILRSLSTGDRLPLVERHRLGATNAPHVVIECDGGTQPAVFQNNQWDRSVAEVTIFDDVFVDENVYSGLVVGAGHRQNLHELILGAQGVALTQQLDSLMQQIERHNSDLRTKAGAIPEAVRGGLPVADFCALPARSDIDDAIVRAERALAAAQEEDQVRNAHTFDSFSLPDIDESEIDDALAKDLPSLDASAAARVEAHVASLGGEAEGWVATGMTLLAAAEENHDAETCPFCAQDLAASPVIEFYRTYFSDAYATHTKELAAARRNFQRAHSGEVFAAFERGIRVASERRQFWSRYSEVPELNLDTAAIVRSWRDAVEAVATAFEAKQAAPLDALTLSEDARREISDYLTQRQLVAERSAALQGANSGIQIVKEQTASANARALAADLARLRAVQTRHTAEYQSLCADYLAEATAKAATEAARANARTALNAYRTNAFPGYETAINLYLGRFNAGFRLQRFTPSDTRGGPTCTYNVLINNTAVPVSGAAPAPGQPSFRNTLSSGDRNTLALAFFFASLERDPDLDQRIVVIDDPISSLDEHRSLTTVQELRDLADQAQQVIVLSHNKAFLCRIWESADRTSRAALQVVRDGSGSSLAEWDVNADAETEHDRRHTLLSDYLASSTGDSRAVARALRPHVESFLRVAYPAQFPASTLLGPFRSLCDQRAGTAQEILSRTDTDELANLVEYANRFHHDTNPAWETEAVNDGELHGFASRTLAFVRR